MGTKYFAYIRCSTVQQSYDRQYKQLNDFISKEGIKLSPENIVCEKRTGKNQDRPLFKKLVADLKALERSTIARAKIENREVATIDDARCAIRIYTAALKSVGLTPETSGTIEDVYSDKEMMVIKEMENKIKTKMDFDGGRLSAESIKGLEIECGMLCYENGVDRENIFEVAFENVEDSL